MALAKIFCKIVINTLLVSSIAYGVTFPKEKIKVGSKEVLVEIAETERQQEYGLMKRRALPADEGMLFVFADERIRFFWMKDTLIDLSIAYADREGRIVDIQEMKAMTKGQADFPSYPSLKPAQYALEMNKNWFSKNKIRVGMKIKRLR